MRIRIETIIVPMIMNQDRSLLKIAITRRKRNENNQIYIRTAFYQVTISRDREHWEKCFSKDVRALGTHNLCFQFRVICTHQ